MRDFHFSNAVQDVSTQDVFRVLGMLKAYVEDIKADEIVEFYFVTMNLY